MDIRGDAILDLLKEARDALPPDVSGELKSRIDVVLAADVQTGLEDADETAQSRARVMKPLGPRPGEKVLSTGDPDYHGIVTGPSDYEGGVMVRFSKSLQYPCSIPLLKVIDLSPNDREAHDFEAWLFHQSNVTHNCHDLHALTRLWRLDFDWHDNPRETYRSKA